MSGSRAYGPWGNTIATTGTVSGLLGYQSAWTDSAAAKELMGARWYDPLAGDFTSADSAQVSPVPDPAAGNPFAYAADNPLEGTDPSGHMVVNMPGDYGSTPQQSQAIISTAQTVATRTGAAQQEAAEAKALAAAAARSKSAAATKAAAAAAARAQAAAAALKVAVAAKAKAVNDLAAAQQSAAAAARAREAAQAAAREAQIAKLTQLQRQADALVPADGPSASGQVRCDSVESRLDGPCHDVVPSGSGGGALANFGGGFLNSLYSLAMGSCGGGVAGLIGGPQPPCRLPVGNPDSGAYKAGNFAGDIAALFAAGGDGDPADPGIPADDPGAANTRSKTADACSGGSSFTPGTRVQLANGKTVPIASLKPGDMVLATDTRTGKDQPEAVTAVMVHHDTDLYDLSVKTAGGTEVIHTTSSHLFWDPYPHYGWIPANHLKPGMHLKTQDGKSAVVVSGSVPAVHDGWMWDLTVQDDHDFYVEPAVVLPPSRAGPSDVAVLVHNCGEYNNFYGGSEGGVMATLDKDGVLSLAIEKGPTTPNGGQMFTDAVNNFGADNINGIAGKWVRAMPSNLNHLQ